MDENTARWRVFRLAVLAGWPWPGTYDWALHPSTRSPLCELLEQYPDAARRPDDPPQGES